jgi:hypothetical protein
MKFNLLIIFYFLLYTKCFKNKTNSNTEHINQNKNVKDLFDNFYGYKLLPAEFLLETQQIDYDLINLGLKNSRILSERINSNKKYKTPCNCKIVHFDSF